MVARYRKTLEQLTIMLQIIKTRNYLPAGAIVDFQLLILKKIKEAEVAISRTKEKLQKLRLEKANDRPKKDRANEIRNLIKRLDNKVEDYKYIIYIWKMYVESVAFHFCDKYAIKHFLYDDKYRVKESAGFVSGKDGIKAEIALLKTAAKFNIPAVLCDLTNTLRHGDVCLLGGNDPYPIEVKTSKKIDKRGEKQLRSIGELCDFFTKDQAANFRSAGPVVRREHLGKEKCHLKAINSCIGDCYANGTSHISPENGIHYLAITKFNKEIFDHISARYVHVFNLNECKNAMTWHPYTPFHLTLNAEHLYNFISGNLTIVVILDLQMIKRRFMRSGLHIVFLQDENWYAQISTTGNILDGGFRVSTQSFLRIVYEFQSLTWAIKQHKKHLSDFVDDKVHFGSAMEIPSDWIAATDGIPM